MVYAKSGKDDQASESFKEVVRIYEEMPDSQREELKRNLDRKLRAKENLSEAIKFFEQQRDEFMTQKAKELIKVIEV